MTKDEAIEMLIAFAYCSIREMSCCECPRHKPRDEDELDSWCDEWDDRDVIEAVRTLEKEGQA